MSIADTYRRTRNDAAAIAADPGEQPQIRAAMRATAATNDRLLSGCAGRPVLSNGLSATEAARPGARLPRATVRVTW